MVNIPPNLQGAWEKAAKDGKIDFKDAQDLLLAAAPGLANIKDPKEIDAILAKELDPEEKAFLDAFKATKDGKVLSVEPGKAKETFSFIEEKAETPAQNDKPVEAPKNDKPTETGKATNPEVAPKENAEKPSANAERIKNLQELKERLPVVFGDDPNAIAENAKLIDSKVKGIQEKDALNTYLDSAQTILNTVDTYAKDGNSDALDKAKLLLTNGLNNLPESLRNSENVQTIYKSTLEKIFTATKSSFISEINTVIDSAATEALKTGNLASLTKAKNDIENLLGKYSSLENDPTFQKIKDILEKAKAGTLKDVPTTDTARSNANTKLQAAIDRVNSVNGLVNKKDWNKEDAGKSQELIKDLPDGALKTKLAEKTKVYNDITLRNRESNISNSGTTVKGLHDVIGNGFFNAENKDGTKALFQLLAKQNLLEETLRRMNTDDQKEAINVLTSGMKNGAKSSSDEFNLNLARKIYENLSKSSNVDDDINKKILPLLKKEPAKDLSSFQIDLDSYAKGMKYSISNEQEAGLTMARGIINGEVPVAVLSKFSKSEIDTLVGLVDKKGMPEEKNRLLSKITEAYNAGNAVNIDNLRSYEKSKIIKQVLSEDKPNESKLSEMVKKVGNDSIFNAVKNQDLTDKQLGILAKHTDGDDMADNVDVAVKLLHGMIKTYIQDQKGPVSLEDINKFISEIDDDWNDDDDVMTKVIRQLGDGPDSEYAKFKVLAPSTLDKMWKIAD